MVRRTIRSRFYVWWPFLLSLFFHTIPVHIPLAAVESLLNALGKEKTRLCLRLTSGKVASLPFATDPYDSIRTTITIKGNNYYGTLVANSCRVSRSPCFPFCTFPHSHPNLPSTFTDLTLCL